MAELKEAVRFSLQQSGLDVLENPERFSELVLGHIDSDSREAKVIRSSCDKAFLHEFVSCTTGADLHKAAEAAATYLNDEHIIDPKYATIVAFNVAAGCALFLGIEDASLDAPEEARLASTKSTRASKRKRTGSIKLTPKRVAAVLVPIVIAVAIASHFFPLFGCTLFPQSTTVAGIECNWYLTNNAEGERCSIVYLKNTGSEGLAVTSTNSCYPETPSVRLSPGGQGIILIKGDFTTDSIRVEKRSGADVEQQMYTNNLSWQLIRDDHKDIETLRITNAGDATVSLRTNAITVSNNGLRSCAISTSNGNYKNQLGPGYSDIYIDSIRANISVGDRLVVDSNTEVYINGAKIPRAEEWLIDTPSSQ